MEGVQGEGCMEGKGWTEDEWRVCVEGVWSVWRVSMGLVYSHSALYAAVLRGVTSLCCLTLTLTLIDSVHLVCVGSTLTECTF